MKRWMAVTAVVAMLIYAVLWIGWMQNWTWLAVADQRMLDRMILFSDAVFAFALLLLASDLRLPETITDETIWSELAALAPQLASFLISFGLASFGGWCT